ncbi:MAG: biotin--[acetyl-CoA-carboxylase] ligase [Candidatus Omnitrophica bacterium]|nr:biotin--[acetyl-CoA-carboxylase] ligase [Candidatus Omnitrophota bacterium]
MMTKIINILKDADGLVSGEELSRWLGITRSAVWKHVEDLRAAGYGIEALPRLGYRLVDVPDLVSAAEVQRGLGTVKFGSRVVHFPVVDSTMNEAFSLALEGAPEGTVVVAETQTKGRGRLGRAWSSPKGKGLYFSVILRPPCAPSDAARLTLLAAVAVSEGIENNVGVRALIKWPNDLLVNDRKLCGILTELNAEVDRVNFVIVGIGLNVNTVPSQLLPEATSLRIVQGKTVSRVSLLQEILRVFESRYQAMLKDGYGDALAEWRMRSALDGRTVRFAERGREIVGTAVGLHDDGGLLVRLADGSTVKRMAGDIRI